MGKIVKRMVVFVLLLLVGTVAAARYLNYDDHDSALVSDGLRSDDGGRQEESFLFLREMNSSEEPYCHEMYGFLPCSTNLQGHILLIGIYHYLLYYAEFYVSGDERDHLFGKGYWGAVLFQILDSLPEPLILSVSVAWSNDEETEEHLVTAVGLLVGSSILLLTFVWGFCILFGQQKFDVKQERTNWLQIFTDSGVVTDSDMSIHAKFMLFSLLPFIVILLPRVAGLSYDSQEYKDLFLITYLAACTCLLCYFGYQYVDERIWKRRLYYAEREKKFEMRVPFSEVQALVEKKDQHLTRAAEAMEEKIATQTNNENMIERVKSFNIFKEWLFETRYSMDEPNSETELSQVAGVLLEDKVSFMKLIDDVMLRRVVQNRTDDEPDELTINDVFDMIDEDGNSAISLSELKIFILASKDDEMVDEEVVEMIMTRFDIEGNRSIDRNEFKIGITEWLEEIKRYEPLKQIQDGYRKAEEKQRAKGKSEAIILVVTGLVMLTSLAEPLTQSVQDLSESLNIPPFYISFIVVPVATNLRTALSASAATYQKKHRTISATFSEIYNKVFMNNIMGFVFLLFVMYIRDLTWHFSAEVLALVIVCTVIGLLASIMPKVPNWIAFFAFFLYPMSLRIVYWLPDTF